MGQNPNWQATLKKNRNWYIRIEKADYSTANTQSLAALGQIGLFASSESRLRGNSNI